LYPICGSSTSIKQIDYIDWSYAQRTGCHARRSAACSTSGVLREEPPQQVSAGRLSASLRSAHLCLPVLAARPGRQVQAGRRGGTRFLRENGFLKKTQVRREQQEKMGFQKSGIRELAPVNPTATVGLQSSLDGS